jgi:hypothetical protein
MAGAASRGRSATTGRPEDGEGIEKVKGKPPAFPFYARDWLASQSVRLMSPCQRGYFIQLLAEAWASDRPGYLPSSYPPWQLAGAKSEKEFLSNGGEFILSRFARNKGRLFNKRLVAERRKQIAYSKLQSQKGLAGAEKRWQRPSSGDSGKMHVNGSRPGSSRPGSSRPGSSSSPGQEPTTTEPPEALLKLLDWKPPGRNGEPLELGFDLDAIEKLWAGCRKNDPTCTGEQVFAACNEKFREHFQRPAGNPVNNWVGFMLRAIPRCFEKPR